MVNSLADTGAQSNLCVWKNFKDGGLGKNDLPSVLVTTQDANKISVNILGAFRAIVSGMSPKNEVISCTSII